MRKKVHKLEKNEQLLISIITVVYNAVSTVEETILSVINQTDVSFEYIIIDGGSTDGTLNIINKYSNQIKTIISEPDQGIYDAMNKGINISKGDFIYFIGADDILLPQVLKKITPFFKNNKIIYGNVLYKNRNTLYDGNFGQLKIVTRNICHQSIFYPTKVFSEFKYNLKYKIYADYDLNLRLFNHPFFSFKHIPITVALYNDLGSSGSNSRDISFENDRISIIRKKFPFWVYFYRLMRTKTVNLLK